MSSTLRRSHWFYLLFVQTGLEYLVYWKGYPIEEASWEPSRNLSPALIEHFVSPPSPPDDIVRETAHALACKIRSTLVCSKQHTFQVPLSRGLYRQIFSSVDANAPSTQFHLAQASEPYFPAHSLIQLNSHGEGFEVEKLLVRHRIHRQKTGYAVVDGKLVPQKLVFFDELAVQVHKKIRCVNVHLVSVPRRVFLISKIRKLALSQVSISDIICLTAMCFWPHNPRPRRTRHENSVSALHNRCRLSWEGIRGKCLNGVAHQHIKHT